MPEPSPTLPPFPPDALGITSTIPLEVPLAAGRRVIDLNNLFVRSGDPAWFVRLAEAEGFPRTCCSWIRGLYGLLRTAGIRGGIFVTGGDCSNTHAMMETLLPGLAEVHTFSFPCPPSREALRQEIDRFCAALGTTPAAAEGMGRTLAPLRRSLAELDRLTWEEDRVTGAENHQWLVSSSDFGGDPARFAADLDRFLDEVRARPPRHDQLRIGLLGVPPIMTDLHEFLESLGARVVYNEIPRQFAMPDNTSDLVDRYLGYTYPYGVWPRVADIRRAALPRRIDGFVHYTQAFCHRQIHDIVFRRELAAPILTVEGETPGPCDPRTRLRLESFIEILKENRG
ncbi:MAG: 2-hydroxyacyl-CoA dehydratase [Candidatus Riflebacteria bacterium]|nr:2-hydroxyacyl-CoA dehydratase [Candidatus Riflebacteria bacterium]